MTIFQRAFPGFRADTSVANSKHVHLLIRENLFKRLLAFMLYAVIGYLVVGQFLLAVNQQPIAHRMVTLFANALTLLIFLGARLLTSRGHWQFGGIVIACYFGLTAALSVMGGMHDGAAYFYIVIVIFTSVVLGYKAATLSIFVCILIELAVPSVQYPDALKVPYTWEYVFTFMAIGLGVTYFVQWFFKRQLQQYNSKVETQIQSLECQGAQLKLNQARLERLRLKNSEELKIRQRTLKESISRTEQLRIQAEKSLRAKSDFLSNISHEIRTPMNGIISMSELIAKTALNPEQKIYTTTIQNTGRHVLSIVDNILDLALLESGKFSLHTHSFEINRFFSELERTLALKAPSSELLIRTSNRLRNKVVVDGDEERLRKVILNLAVNMHNQTTKLDKTKLEVSIEPDNKTALQIRVSINFQIQKRHSPKTSKSHSVPSATFSADSYSATDLGVSLSEKLITVLGGYIKRPQKGGYRMAILLPVTEQETYSSVYPKVSSDLPLSKNILIVEDDPVNRKVMLRVLENIGCRVILAGSGREALQMLTASENVDLIFMDCQMPDMDGFETTRCIRKKLKMKSIPIVAVTGDVLPNTKKKCFEAGMNDFISKPVQLSVITRILRIYLR